LGVREPLPGPRVWAQYRGLGCGKRIAAPARAVPASERGDGLGHAVVLAVASGEHYLPPPYALALQRADEPISYNDVPVGGSVTMTSLVVGSVG
jgi:hypothetical protein